MSLLLPVSSVAQAGDVLTVTLGLKAQHPLDRDYSVFVHLYGDPTPYEGGAMLAQGDSQACATYPSHLWQTSETIVQDFTLRLPTGLPQERIWWPSAFTRAQPGRGSPSPGRSRGRMITFSFRAWPSSDLRTARSRSIAKLRPITRRLATDWPTGPMADVVCAGALPVV